MLKKIVQYDEDNPLVSTYYFITPSIRKFAILFEIFHWNPVGKP